MSNLERSLFKLFSEYSMQGNLYSHSQLSVSRLRELFKDAYVFDELFSPTQLNLVLHSVNSRNPSLTFKKFCEITGKVAEARYPEEFAEDPMAAFSTFMSNHLLMHSGKISQNLSTVSRPDLNLSNNILLIAKNLEKSFRFIYRKYFPWEIKGDLPLDDTHNRSLKELEKLLKDFDIYPSIINKAKVHGIWRDVVILQDETFQKHVTEALIPPGSRDWGKLLTLSKFILIFYFCSVYGYQEHTLHQDSFTERFLMLLERVHLSVSQIYKTISLLPSKDTLHTIRYHNSDIGSGKVETQSMEDTSASDISLEQESINIFELYINKLRDKFAEYCSLYKISPALNNGNYLKLLRDSRLLREEPGSIRPMSLTDADLIYAAVSGRRRSDRLGRMDFKGFLKAIELIAKKVYSQISLHAAVESLITESLLGASHLGNRHSVMKEHLFLKNLEKLQDPAVGEVLRLLQSPLRQFYIFYADSSELMNFDKFLSFNRDFEIFPDIVNKLGLIRVFMYLMGTEEMNEGNIVLSVNSVFEQGFECRNETLNLSLFVEGLGIIAVGTEEDDSSIVKLSLFVERMLQSKGKEKVARAMGYSRACEDEVRAVLRHVKLRFSSLFRVRMRNNISFEEFALSYKD